MDSEAQYIKAQTEPIHSRTLECLERFDENLRDLNTANHQYAAIQELRGRFYQWATYAGALAVPRASLDARLSLLPTTKQMILELLNMTYKNLLWAKGTQQWAKDPDTPGFGAVAAMVDRLFVLAVQVRRASRDLYRANPGHWHEQHELLRSLVHHKYPKAKPSLLSQLAASIHMRGTSLQYLRLHNEQVASARRNETNPIGKFRDEKTVSSEAMAAGGMTMAESGLAPNAPTSTPDPSQPTVSQLIIARDRTGNSPASVISQGSSTGEIAEECLYLPVPLKQNQCCICADPLSSSKISKDEWIAHIQQDLEPYVCISEECVDSAQFFAFFDKWLEHMQQHHSVNWAQKIHMKWWFCDICKPSTTRFDDQNSLVTHYKAQHGNTLTASQIYGRARRNRRVARRQSPFTCPLCLYEPDQLQPVIPENPYRLLAEHIGDHLKSMSFFSLSYVEIDLGDSRSELTTAINTDHATYASLHPSLPADFDGIPETEIYPNGNRVFLDKDTSLGLMVVCFEDGPPLLPAEIDWQSMGFRKSLPTDYEVLRNFAYKGSDDVLKKPVLTRHTILERKAIRPAAIVQPARGEDDDDSFETDVTQTALWVAASRGLESIVQQLIDVGADIEASDGEYRTLLSFAVERQNEPLARLLLQAGADIETDNIKYRTPLSQAALLGYPTLVSLLLSKGAKIETEDERYRTPLLLATKRGHYEVVRLLIRRGANIEARDGDGNTPLFYAKKYGFTTIQRILARQ